MALVVRQTFPILEIVRKVNFFRRPETGFSLFIELPDIVILDGEYDKPILVLRQEGFVNIGYLSGHRHSRSVVVRCGDTPLPTDTTATARLHTPEAVVDIVREWCSEGNDWLHCFEDDVQQQPQDKTQVLAQHDSRPKGSSYPLWKTVRVLGDASGQAP